MSTKRKDILWKGGIEDFFEYLLHFFFPDLLAMIDLNRGFDFLDKEMRELFPCEDPEHPKFIDKLIRVYLRTGVEKWFLIHIEVQGYMQKIFAERMFRYFYRIRDKYNKDVISLAIYLNKQTHSNSRAYTYRFGNTVLNFDFHRYYIGDQDEEELSKSENPFALIILTALIGLKKRLKDNELAELKYDLTRRLLKSKMPREKILQLMGFVNSYLPFKEKENNIKFAKRIEPLITKNTSMGILEILADEAKKEGIKIGEKLGKKEGWKNGERRGKKEGIKDAQTAIISNMLMTTDLSISKIASLANVSPAFVSKIKKGIYHAS